MTGLAGLAAQLCTVLALVCGAAVLARTRSVAQALPVLLELLLAAGLLRLTHDPTWESLATAAAVVGLRRLVAHGLRPGERRTAQLSGRRPDGPGRPAPRPGARAAPRR